VTPLSSLECKKHLATNIIVTQDCQIRNKAGMNGDRETLTLIVDSVFEWQMPSILREACEARLAVL